MRREAPRSAGLFEHSGKEGDDPHGEIDEPRFKFVCLLLIHSDSIVIENIRWTMTNRKSFGSIWSGFYPRIPLIRAIEAFSAPRGTRSTPRPHAADRRRSSHGGAAG